MCRVLPGARQESLRFTAEKTLSIKERFPYCSVGKFSRIWRRTPDALQLERRLAGMMLWPELLAAKGMIAFGVKFGVGQHTADWEYVDAPERPG